MSHPTDVIDNALSTRQTLITTYNMALDCIRRGVPGDFVECGVFAGAQCAAMAMALMGPNWNGKPDIYGTPTRRVHLFDSFQGIPLAGEHDNDFRNGKHPAGTSACSLEDVKVNMDRWGVPQELLAYHPGWFSDTMRRLAHPPLTQIALLRLDADLYESTAVCLEYLMPLLSPGGWLIVDDFGLDGCRKAVLEHFAPSAPWPLYWQQP